MNFKEYRIEVIEDIDENKGGYNCEIYLKNDDTNNMIDYFYIPPEDLKINKNIEYWITKYINENENEFKTIYFYDNTLGRYKQCRVECEYLNINRLFENFEDAINYAVQLSDINSFKVQFYR